MNTSISVIDIDAPAERVWYALVDPEKVKLWQYGSDLVTTWVVGSPIRFITPWGDKIFEQWGTVIEVVPLKLLKYSLFAPRPGLADSPENYFVMSYKLEESGGKTKLSIIQDDPRPQTQPTKDDDSGNAILSGLKKLVESCD